MTTSRHHWPLHGLLLLLLAIAGLRLHRLGGVRIEWVGTGLLLAPVLVPTLLMSARAGRALLALEGITLLSLIALAATPNDALPLAVLASLLACHASRSLDAPTGPPRLEPVLALAALVACGLDLGRDSNFAALRLAVAGLALVEAALPGRDRGPRAVLRRRASAVSLLALSWTPHVGAALPTLNALFVGLTTGVALAVLRWGGDDPRAARRYGFRLVLITAPFALTFVLGELAFRIVPNRYATLVSQREMAEGQWHVPHGTWTYRGAFLSPRQPTTNTVRWNAGGWHDVDHAREKPPGTVRIVVLGDSFIEGVQVPLEALYHRVLEAELRRRTGATVEVIGIGWSGWGQRQELQALRAHGLAYDPDLVVVEFLVSNDVRNNLPALEDAANAQEKRGSLARELFIDALDARLFFSAFVCDRLHDLSTKLFPQPDPLAPDSPTWETAWAETEALWKAFQAELKPRGVGLLAVAFPDAREIEKLAADPGAARRVDRFGELCRRLALAWVDLGPRLAGVPDEERARIYMKNDGHFSPTGHRLAAQETARRLAQSPLWEAARRRAGEPQ